ncbi:MAG: hypothetical protein GX594_16615 [Pirellulaceae bacterium]|nr:hypothetical protein [Pirellulaceae bacterium]
MSVIDCPEKPVIGKDTPGSEGNRHGFEGGRAVKLGDAYHVFTSEMIDDPRGVKMKLAHWKSDKLHQWKRVSTLYESSAKFDGSDPRAALWSPMPIWNEQSGRWNLFYVAYRAAANTPDKWLLNYEGRIYRAVSITPGKEGIGGPYEDRSVILEPDLNSQPWEGLQGVDSFFPYQVGDRWYGFYGSANTEVVPCKYWRVGLASAERLAGPWKRLPEGNPTQLEKTWGVENPVVTRLPSGRYVVLFAVINGPPDRLGYASSDNGAQWSPARHLILKESKNWLESVRTVLGLFEGEDGRYTLFYTGGWRSPDKDEVYYSVGLISVLLNEPAKNK